MRRSLRLFSALKEITEIQNVYCDYGIIGKVISLVERNSHDVSMEVLSLLDVLLFNANPKVQVHKISSISEHTSLF